MTVLLHAGAVLLAVPVEPTEATARELLSRELAKSEYAGSQPSLLDRFSAWLDNLLANASGLPAPVGVLIAVAVVVIAVVIVLFMAGPARWSAKPANTSAAVFDEDGDVTADQHWQRAEEHAAAGRWVEAVREAVRAIVRELQDRTILDARPGLTAHEAAWEAGARLPEVAERLHRAATLFDAVTFGSASATSADYETLKALAPEVRKARPIQVGAVAPSLVVPR